MTKSSGAVYIRCGLDDAVGSTPALIWPDVLHQVTEVMCPGPVWVVGRLQGSGSEAYLQVERIASLDIDSSGSGLSALPRRWCPADALPAFDALLSLERGWPAPLRRFIAGALLDTRMTPGFLRCRGAVSYHHAFRGGLLVHSMELMPLVRPIVEALYGRYPEQEVELRVSVTQCLLLVHDIGKVWTVGEESRPRRLTSDSTLSHEQWGLRYMTPMLDRLAMTWPEGASLLRLGVTYLAEPRERRGYAPDLCIDVVRRLDQWGTGMDRLG